MPIVPQGRICTRCSEWKPATEFKRVTCQPHKLRSHCHACVLIEQQARRDRQVTRLCAACGIEYQCRNGESRYCASCGEARRFANLEQREKMCLVCKQCERGFPSDRSNKQYCTRACKTLALRGKPTKKRGGTYPKAWRAAVHTCPGCNTEFRGVKDTKRAIQIYCSHRCYLRCRKVSHFENRVMAMIEASGCTVERQAKRGRWSFDGALVGSNILIEADGTYWHSGAVVQARDARKDQWCQDNGYTLMRVAVAPILRRAEAEGLTCERITE